MRKSIFEPGPGKWDPNEMHNLNLRRALTCVAAHPGSTAADVSRATALSPATVFRLMESLLAQDLVVEGQRVRGKRGQPGVSLQMNPMGAYSIGCQVGYGTGFAFLRSLGGEVVAERDFTFESCSARHIAERVAEAFGQLMAGQPETVVDRLVGMGVAVPVDFGRLGESWIGKTADSAIWHERTFQESLETAINVPVTTYSTGNAGAWAELALRPPPRPADYLYLFLDHSIQSGLLLGGRLWKGPHNRTGGIGRALASGSKQSSRLYDLVTPITVASEAGPAGAVDPNAITAVAEAICGPTQVLCDSMDIPLVIVDGTLPGGVLDDLVAAMNAALPQLTWGTPPLVSRGKGGVRSPAKGAALRPIYTAYFSDGTG